MSISSNNIDTNFDDYYKLFEDYSIYNDKKIFIFKYTFDFCLELSCHTYIDEVIKLAEKNTIIYLDRNNEECYISKKLADKYGYANIYYDNLDEVNIIHEELKKIIDNKKKFEHEYINFKNIKYYLNYYEINNSNNICEFINKILSIVNDDNCDYLDKTLYNIIKHNLGDKYFNIKQSSCIDYKNIKFI